MAAEMRDRQQISRTFRLVRYTVAPRQPYRSRMSASRTPVRVASLLLAFLTCGAAHARAYDALFTVELQPKLGKAAVTLKLDGSGVPSRLEFAIEPGRHTGFRGDGAIEEAGDRVTWNPPANGGRLQFDFRIDHVRRDGMMDSHMTDTWAIFRGDRLVPPVSVTARRSARSRSTIEFVLPRGWSVATPFEPAGEHRYAISDPRRRFDRPKGWIIAGEIGTRIETVVNTKAIVSAPMGDSMRRQDTLAFLNWTLPHIINVFPDFPRRFLVIRAGDPMFRGGLSGPSSLFLHADRPLISENRTSTLLHELVHLATGLYGDDESDWIVEGLAEYYSLETLRRSGTISDRRYRESIERLARWARKSKTLFRERSSGATTARAVIVFKGVDQEIRRLTDGEASLDDVARRLAEKRGLVSLERLQSVAAQVAGQPLQSLERRNLAGD